MWLLAVTVHWTADWRQQIIGSWPVSVWLASSLKEVSLITTCQPSASFLAEPFLSSPLILDAALALSHTSPYEWVTAFPIEPFLHQRSATLTVEVLSNNCASFHAPNLQLPPPAVRLHGVHALTQTQPFILWMPFFSKQNKVTLLHVSRSVSGGRQTDLSSYITLFTYLLFLFGPFIYYFDLTWSDFKSWLTATSPKYFQWNALWTWGSPSFASWFWILNMCLCFGLTPVPALVGEWPLDFGSSDFILTWHNTIQVISCSRWARWHVHTDDAESVAAVSLGAAPQAFLYTSLILFLHLVNWFYCHVSECFYLTSSFGFILKLIKVQFQYLAFWQSGTFFSAGESEHGCY